MSDNLTIDELIKVKKNIEALLPPVLVYATTEYVEVGQIIHHRETNSTPEFFICNPDDLAALVAQLSDTYRFVHMNDYRPRPKRLKIEPPKVDTDVTRWQWTLKGRW